MNDQSNQGKLGSVYFQMHRVGWVTPSGDELVLFVAGSEPHIAATAAARLAKTISDELLTTVTDEIILSTEVDLDELPF